jgi:hypothetical protein
MKNLNNIIKKVLKEESERYMFFSNLEQIRRQCGLLLDLDHNMVEEILSNGHDWAQDHIAEAKNNMDQVFDFLMNESKSGDMWKSEEVIEDDNLEDLALADEADGMNPNKSLGLSMTNVTEGRKKAGTKLCARGKAAAKSKFDVYPSAYANGYAVQVCKGTKPGLDGKKHCSGAYC